MGTLFQNIDNALREEDIESLIEYGAPDDEYSSEAKEIAEILKVSDKLNKDEIISVVSAIWAKSFNRSPEEIEIRMPSFINIAQKLMNSSV